MKKKLSEKQHQAEQRRIKQDYVQRIKRAQKEYEILCKKLHKEKIQFEEENHQWGVEAQELHRTKNIWLALKKDPSGGSIFNRLDDRLENLLQEKRTVQIQNDLFRHEQKDYAARMLKVEKLERATLHNLEYQVAEQESLRTKINKLEARDVAKKKVLQTLQTRRDGLQRVGELTKQRKAARQVQRMQLEELEADIKAREKKLEETLRILEPNLEKNLEKQRKELLETKENVLSRLTKKKGIESLINTEGKKCVHNQRALRNELMEGGFADPVRKKDIQSQLEELYGEQLRFIDKILCDNPV